MVSFVSVGFFGCCLGCFFDSCFGLLFGGFVLATGHFKQTIYRLGNTQ